MSSPPPLKGRLVPLRTREEVRATLETQSVYVVEVPSKFANDVKDVLQAAIPEFKPAEISHLRRVVQFKFLPTHLQKQFSPPARLPRGDDNNPATPAKLLLSSPAPLHTPLFSPHRDIDGGTSTVDNSQAETINLVRYFILCPIRYIQHVDLCALLRNCPPFDGRTPRVFYVTTPSLAPISAAQAESWSAKYWPISYKNTNPYGPHPSLVARNTEEIESDAGRWLALARMAGKQISDRCLGEPLGVVVVDPNQSQLEVVAVAGDCRWRSPTGTAEAQVGTGNVMAHAVQRAIAMIAKKRLRAGGTDPALLDRSLFCDSPLTDVEKQFYDRPNIASSGYLCVDLDIYLTNEPCLMCSMAILHSRFRRCVFIKRMPRTGGMTSENESAGRSSESLRHGLFWRPSELNWKFLTWEFKEDGKGTIKVDQVKDLAHV